MKNLDLLSLQKLALFVNCVNIQDCTTYWHDKGSRKKSVALTTILAILVPGVGHIYVGKIKSGVVILVIGVVSYLILSFVADLLTPDGDLTQLLEKDISIAFVILGLVVGLLAFFVWQIVNARKECRKYNSSIV